jgi:hypothetical protein
VVSKKTQKEYPKSKGQGARGKGQGARGKRQEARGKRQEARGKRHKNYCVIFIYYSKELFLLLNIIET